MSVALKGIEATLGRPMLESIEKSKILLVGAGGIGCELLKNLALTGFRYVEVIDLDTIDVSNLNRQLLFRSPHVGKPKCVVACQVAKAMIRDSVEDSQQDTIHYVAHHGNVCDNSFCNVPFISQFDIVLNALDNVAARRRVNRLSLAAKVPLVEAGTTGYLGQVSVIDKPSNVACYECKTQEAPKVYPICTIRSTPSMPVHTLVWAKELYKLLFGEKAEESMLFEDPAGDEPSTYMDAVLSFRKSESSSASDILKTLYADEIQKQLDMERYKTALKTPVPLSQETLAKIPSLKGRPTKSSMDTWTLEECVAQLAAQLTEATESKESILPHFDKDDAFAMEFVTAASNLRSYVFGIEPQSLYNAKGIAGNIIPAIATTNAIVAGVQILQVFNILKAKLENPKDKSADGTLGKVCRYINCVRNKTRNGLVLLAGSLEEPNPKCFVCRSATIPLTINIHKWTLADLLDRVLKKDLGFQEPTITMEGDIFWEEGEDVDPTTFQQNLAKPLSKLPSGGIQNGTVIEVEDFTQDLAVHICFSHQEVWERSEEENEDEEPYLMGGERTKVAEPSAVAAAKPETKEEADDDDDIMIIEAGGDGDKKPAVTTNGGKKRAAEGAEEPKRKRPKLVDENGGKTPAEKDIIDLVDD